MCNLSHGSCKPEQWDLHLWSGDSRCQNIIKTGKWAATSTSSDLLCAFCLSHRASPRLLCTATQQKNGDRSEEEAEKPEQSAAEKGLIEEKSQLEEQLKEMTVRVLRGTLTV